MEKYARMNNEESLPGKVYQWRIPAKFVAYFDLITQIVALVVVFIGVPFLLFTDSNETSNMLGFIWIVAVIAVITLALSIWLTSFLVVATHKETSSEIAQRKANIWMKINIALLVFSLLGNIMNRDVLSVLLSLVVRGGFLLVVRQFIVELNEAVAAEEKYPTAV